MQDRCEDSPFESPSGEDFAKGCILGGATGAGLMLEATGGAPLFIPGVGKVTVGGAAVGGYLGGGIGQAIAGSNPVTRK